MKNTVFQWAIVGAGPAGIAAVGKLIDNGVNPKNILWIDPHFEVGDLGRLWSNVSSNTKVQLFKDFLAASPTFAYPKAPMDFELNHLPTEETCLLNCIVQPLKWVSKNLCDLVLAKKAMITQITLAQRQWKLQSDDQSFHAKNVILATGATPAEYGYLQKETIPLEMAIDKSRLEKMIEPSKTYAVFGSSHSAIIIIEHLVNLGVKKIINFYRSPCRYAINMGDWILFDNIGLKGHTANWAREHIDGTLPKNLERVISNSSNIEKYLPHCDKAIYAIGFKPRTTLAIEGYNSEEYNPHLGIIGPGLFGLGIAYPQIKPDKYGSVEAQVGLWKFMTYLQQILPVWFKYHT